MKPAKRAIRRHHRERMRRKAVRLYPDHSRPCKLADNLAVCSCMACGNPRRWWNMPTMQERRIELC